VSDITREYYASLQRAFAEGPPPQLDEVVEVLFEAFLHGAQVYTMGNGACAALAAHMTCDLGKVVTAPSREGDGGPRSDRLRVTSLADNASLVTATANDFRYEDVFVEQLRHRLRRQDVVVVMSASGTSPNVLRAVEFARACGATTVAFTGGGPGATELISRCDVAVRSPAVDVEQIEDMHVSFNHIVTLALRQRIAAHLAGSSTSERILSSP
jgi:D-sedoheptulose 7-phosphate isomerase